MDFWRYSRQLMLPEIGAEGQKKLENAKVGVAGMGGLGANVSMSLAAMGVGGLRLIDFDVVSEPDLHRQLLYSEADVGYAKVEAASRRLKQMNSAANVEPICERLAYPVSASLLSDLDVMVDCLDSFETKYALNRAAVSAQVSLVHGSALQSYGTVVTFQPWKQPCIECVYPGIRDESMPKCAVVGVWPQLVQVIAAMQSAETVNNIVSGPRLLNRLVFLDISDFSVDSVVLKPSPGCPCFAETPLGVPSNGPAFSCSRDGKPVLTMDVVSKPGVDRVFESFTPEFDARMLGERVVRIVTGDSDFYYTAAGTVIAQIGPRSAEREGSAEQVVLKLAAKISAVR